MKPKSKLKKAKINKEYKARLFTFWYPPYWDDSLKAKRSFYSRFGLRKSERSWKSYRKTQWKVIDES